MAKLNPATIVRPSQTYDRTLVPFDRGWTDLGRMIAGKPVVVHGDGTSPWTLTHHHDFARAFVPLPGHSRTIGEQGAREIVDWYLADPARHPTPARTS